MNLLLKNELTSHDVYEFCYPIHYPKHWNDNSLFLNSDDIVLLSPYLDNIIPNFHYYGEQKITLSDWNAIKSLCIADKPLFDTFFQTLDSWIGDNPQQDNYFWILGI